jgi:hypothetical protein
VPRPPPHPRPPGCRALGPDRTRCRDTAVLGRPSTATLAPPPAGARSLRRVPAGPRDSPGREARIERQLRRWWDPATPRTRRGIRGSSYGRPWDRRGGPKQIAGRQCGQWTVMVTSSGGRPWAGVSSPITTPLGGQVSGPAHPPAPASAVRGSPSSRSLSRACAGSDSRGSAATTTRAASRAAFSSPRGPGRRV